MVDRVHKQKTSKLNPISFEKIIKSPCHNHGYLVKQTLEYCDLIKHYFKGDYKTTGMDEPTRSIDTEEKGDAFPDPKGCLKISGGPIAYESKHRHKLMAKEVSVAIIGEAAIAFLKCLETTITFDRKDHPDHIP